jgi:hypothetical protein
MHAFTAAKKACGKYAGIVEDQQIIGLKQVRKIAELAIIIVAAGPLQIQHSRAVTRRQRLLGDEFGGKIEVEAGN